MLSHTAHPASSLCPRISLTCLNFSSYFLSLTQTFRLYPLPRYSVFYYIHYSNTLLHSVKIFHNSFNLFFWVRVSLCNPVCLRTHAVIQVSLELRDLLTSAFMFFFKKCWNSHIWPSHSSRTSSSGCTVIPDDCFSSSGLWFLPSSAGVVFASLSLLSMLSVFSPFQIYLHLSYWAHNAVFVTKDSTHPQNTLK